MKLAVSNIAWPMEHDAAVADVLRGLGVTGIEVAPTKVWPRPLEATDAEIDAYRRFWDDRGIAIAAAQSLLFGRPDLTLFESDDTQRRTLEYLTGIIRLCGRLGAGALVFGSPKNRRVGSMPRSMSLAPSSSTSILALSCSSTQSARSRPPSEVSPETPALTTS